MVHLYKKKDYKTSNAYIRFESIFHCFKVTNLKDITLSKIEYEKDKEFLLHNIKLEWTLYYYLNSDLQNIKEFFMAAIN